MRKLILLVAAALCLVGLTGQARAQSDTDTINVTVSLADVLSIAVTPTNTWDIGAVALGTFYDNGLESHSVANNGTVMVDMNIEATNGANGWVIGGTPDLDTFAVHANFMTLSTTPALLESNVAAATGVNLSLEYYSPILDTQGGGVDHSFTITITATRSP